MKHLRFISVMALLFITSCKTSMSSPEGLITEDAVSTLWEHPDAIPVCWESYDDRLLWNYYSQKAMATESVIASYKTAIQPIVQAEYKRAGIHLLGWGTCTPTSKGIRIVWTTGGPKVLKFGKALDGVFAGVWIIPPDLDLNGQPYEPIDYMYVTALHEVGHALGLRHEASRRDNNGNCKNFEQGDFGEPGALSLGDFDRYSVMNYCIFDFYKAENLHPVLSQGDVQVLRTMYFEPVAKLIHKDLVVLPPTTFHWEVKDVESYRYAVGEAGTQDCKQEAIYSAASKAADGLAMDLTSWAGKTIKLCLLGQKGTKTQSPLAYSSYQFKVGTAPFAFYDGLKYYPDVTRNIKITFNETLSQASAISAVRYKVGPEKDVNCEEPDKYSAATSDFKTLAIDLTPFSFEKLKLCIATANKKSEEQFKGANSFVFINWGPSEVDIIPLPERPEKVVLATKRHSYKFIPDNEIGSFMAYKFKKASDKKQCALPQDYSPAISIYQFSEMELQTSDAGTVGICSLLQFNNGEWQKPENAHYQYWTLEL